MYRVTQKNAITLQPMGGNRKYASIDTKLEYGFEIRNRMFPTENGVCSLYSLSTGSYKRIYNITTYGEKFYEVTFCNV